MNEAEFSSLEDEALDKYFKICVDIFEQFERDGWPAGLLEELESNDTEEQEQNG